MTLNTLNKLKPDQKILLLGIGTEILQFQDWLINVIGFNPKQICIADKKNIGTQAPINLDIFDESYLGENYLKAFENPQIKYIFKAPGIWSLSPELELFRDKNGQDKVLSSLTFFIHKFKSQIIGVTGTKGKSTTSSLIQHLLVNTGYDSKYCGNTTGISPYQFWKTQDQELVANQRFVIELSSFQLQDLAYSQVSPDFGIITNYYVDHQDQHHGVSEYWRAKDQMFLNQSETGLTIATSQVLEKSANLNSYENKIIVDEKLIEEVNNIVHHNLIGQHNRSNLALAIILVESLESNTSNQGIVIEQIKLNQTLYTELLTTFKPLAHRIELIRTIETADLIVNFYDDGAATEPDAVAAAINSTTEDKNSFIWLQLTGTDPNPVLTNLISTLKNKQSKIFEIDFCGAIGKRVYKELYLEETSLSNFKDTTISKFKSFDNQVQKFLEFTKTKNLDSKPILQVVFSPCGKSFDEFSNYIARCNWWAEQVNLIQ